MGGKKKGASPVDVGSTPATAEALSRNSSYDALDDATRQSKSSKQGKADRPTPQVFAAAGVALFGVLLALGLIPYWLLLQGSLVALAVCLLGGVGVVGELVRDCMARPEGAKGVLVPLTDAQLGVDTLNKLANSCQCREKGLKILQYVLRGSAYSGLLPLGLSKSLKGLSKTTSIARRFFKFFRWVKHFEDLAEAKDERSVLMRTLLYIRVAANFGADWAEDVCSLERLALLPPNTLSLEFMLFAEYCQLVLALVEVYVTTAKVRQEEGRSGETGTPTKLTSTKQQRKLALTRLELVKFVSDIGKALFDCELACSHEGVFITCSLFSALVSTHKNMVKVLK